MGIFSIVINQILDVFKKSFPSLETKQIQVANFYFWPERNCKDMLAKNFANMAINLNTITCLIPAMYNPLKEKTPPTVFSLYWLVRHVLFSLCRKYCVKTSNVCERGIHCQGKMPYRSNIFTFYEQKIHPPGSSKSEQKTKQLVFSLKWRKENNIFKNKVCFKVFQPLHWLVKKEMPFQKTALSRSLLKKWALV